MAERKCGLCREPGHTRRTCPYPALLEAEDGRTAEQAAEIEARRDAGAAGELARLKAVLEEAAVVAPQRDDKTDILTLVDGELDRLAKVLDVDDALPTDAQLAMVERRRELGEFRTAQLESLKTPEHCRAGLCVGCCGCSSMCTDEPCGRPLADVYPDAWERPTAANVTLPAPDPVDVRKTRLIEQLRNAATTMAPAQAAAAEGLAGLAETIRSAPWAKPADVISAPQRDDKTDILSPVDAFLAPTPVGATVDAFLSPTAQTGSYGPEWRQKTERLGYRIKLPTTGEFLTYKNGNLKGVTRTTTFVHAASDSKGITDWNKRNVLLGAARKPDLAAQAFGLDVTEDKRILDDIVAQLEDAGGGNKASSLGTLIHKYTEQIDAGEIKLSDVPPAYRPSLDAYVDELDRHGFEVVPHLIERSVFLEEFGGVVGTFDRVFYHKPTKTYVMGDVKTGKNLHPGWAEIEAQEWVYTQAYNNHGTYTWEPLEDDRDQEYWTPPEFKLRTDYGVVMWIPLTDPKGKPISGVCQLLKTDLSRGRRHAELCATVREERKAKGKPVPWDLPVPGRDWDAEFGAVADGAAANQLWAQARAAGLPTERVRELVAIAKDSLDRLTPEAL